MMTLRRMFLWLNIAPLCKSLVNVNTQENLPRVRSSLHLTLYARKKTANYVSKKQPVLLCPAQLSIMDDYEEAVEIFQSKNRTVFIPDLSRSGWILGLLPSAFTSDYIKGKLIPEKTLKFYYDSIDEAYDKLQNEFPKEPYHIIGHSIGGWIARGWMKDRLKEEDRSLVLSLTTLGTPNKNAPSDNPFSTFDQTRGLLKHINANCPVGVFPDTKFTSVVGTSTKGSLFSFNIEEILAFFSYVPFGGSLDSLGDGIIPWKIGILEGSRSILLPNVKHSGFVPLFGKSMKLPPEKFPWYLDSNTIDQWLHVLSEAEEEYERRKARSHSRWFGLKKISLP